MANDGSFAPAISADGNRIAFASLASNLVVGVRRQRRHPGRLRARHGRRHDLARQPHDRSERDLGQRRLGTAVDRRVRDPHRVRDVRERSGPGDASTAARTCSCATRSRDRPSSSAGARCPTARRHAESGTPSISGNGDCVAFQTRADAVRGDAAGHRPHGCSRGRCAATARSGRWRTAGAARRPAAGPRRPPTPRVPSSRASARAAPLPRGQTRQAAHAHATGDRVALRFTLSEAASVTIQIDALLPGRRLKKRCVPPRRAPRGRRCKRASGAVR